ncbi:MAG: hypothetical protein H0T76_00525 [Nannocystis sp.]|nr:hypothetical protein [Nannocystis sp.]MBA3544944.1 hypothetical protein [Nannocystis sp.]
MGLLSTLLHEASARHPAEVVIETDQPVRMHLSDGTQTQLAGAIGGTAISDELSDLLSTEQQVDLALGEQVKFDLVVGPYTWQLVGETASEVISVRARPTGELLDASDSMQIPIEPDDSDPVEPQDVPRPRRALASGPSEIDIDINFDDEAALAQDDPRPAAGLRLAALKSVPADSKPQPMWPRRQAAPQAQGKAGAPTWAREGRRGRTQPVGFPGPSGKVGPSGPVGYPGPASATATQQMPLRPAPRREDLGEILGAFGPGTLVLLLRAPGQGEQLTAAIELPTVILGDGDRPEQASARITELGPIGVLLLRVEDPSLWLGWLLRRIEEGHRVLVETDARTPAGARRVLLGVDGSPRAEQWLDAVPVRSATVEDGRWMLLPGR